MTQDQDGPDHFNVLQQCMQSIDHKKSINLIAEYIQRNIIRCETPHEGCIHIKQIVQILLSPSVEKNLKKGIVKCIMKIPKKWHSEVFAEISHYLDGSSVTDPSATQITIRNYFENVVVLLGDEVVYQNILVANFSQIASAYECVLNRLSTSLKQELTKVKEIEIAELFHFLIQTLIVFVDESCKCKSSVDVPPSLYQSILDLMSNNKIGVNTINNCGLLLVTMNYHFFTVSSSLTLLKKFVENSPIQCLAICHGFLASASFNLYISSSSDNLLVQICGVLWRIHSTYANDTLVVIGILKIVLLLVKKVNFENHRVPENCVEHLINLVLPYLDHFLNPAKNLAKEALNQLTLQKNEFVISKLLDIIEKTRRIDRKTCLILTALCNVIKFSRILASYETIIEDLRSSIKNTVSTSYMCQVYLSLMISDYSNEKVDHWFDTWMKPILKECSNYNLLLEYIFVPVVKLSDAVFEKIMRYDRLVDESNYSVIVKFLLETKACHPSSIDDLPNVSQLNLNSNRWKNLLPFEMMIRASCVPNSMDALNTARLIVEHIKGKYCTPEEIEVLKFFIDSQFSTDKSDFRCKFLNLQMQLFVKISHHLHPNDSNSDTKHIFDFVDWIIRYSLSNLFAGASYGRRFTALRMCKMLIDLNLWLPTFINRDTVKTFLYSLSDGYEENELIAKDILLRILSQNPHLMSDADKLSLYGDTIEMINGMRFSEHNTAAYLLEILCCTSRSMVYFSNIAPEHETGNLVQRFENLEVHERDCYFIHLQILVSKLKTQLSLCRKENIIKYPLHGFLHVIRYLLNHVPLEDQSIVDITSWKVLINDIIHVSISCNEFAVFIVSHSSPEGYLPDEAYDEDEHNVFNAAQQTLLCNWRAVKGASLVLGDLVEKFSVGYTDDNEAYLYKDTFLIIGDHLKTLIYQIKHKGSFKQVYIALFQYCKRCWRSSDYEINAIPKQWLKEIENMIVTSAKQLCLTRRSAGIPCIVLAIICTEFDDKRKFTSNLLNEFMKNMLKILNDQEAEVETKIHALNIVRDLFVHKDLAEQIHGFVEKGVIIAIAGFKSSNWNERNTSNLLLSAILTRIFGVSRSRTTVSWKNKMTGKFFFQKYPLLFDVFLFHLQQNEYEDVNVQSALYPILLILARLYPSYHDEWNSTFQLSTFIPYIYSCCENPIFKIRQLAAQAIVPLITRDIYVEHLRKIWTHVLLPIPENAKHGLLLQFDGLLQNVPELNEKQNEDFQLLSVHILLEADPLLRSNHSLVVKEKLLNILSSLLKRYHHATDFSKMENYFSHESTSNSHECNLNERNFITASITFNIGLKYLSSFRNNNSSEFLNFLETMIQREPVEQNSNIVVDFLIELISEDESDSDNSILRNLISNHDKHALKKIVLNSKTIYLHVLKKLSDDKSHRLFDMLCILPEFLKQFQEKRTIKTLSLFCRKYSNNGKLIVPLLSCIDILLENQEYWDDEYFFIIKSLLSSYHKLCVDGQRKLRRLLFKLCTSDYLNNDIYLKLDVWIFIVGKISCIDEQDFVFLKHICCEPFRYEDYFLAQKFIGSFCDSFQSLPSFCAVGLISWIIQNLGVIFNNVIKNDVFFEDLPYYFEDHLLICQFSSKYLNTLLERCPFIMDEHLSEATLSWIMEQGGLKKATCAIDTMRDLISYIVRLFENEISPEFAKTSDTAFLPSETVERRIVEVKLSLLSSLLN
ncbi:tRNA (32-2'-O)-methyltransferase regulator THADA isoform X2 [Planococcus citri]|uniref:tRNA (32-2'-O)-methyltransferase regulator THADA isoform X2 n=1 Tax=Planococcus citri TaxID=170843 RepID=UPI0031F94C3F